MFHKVQLIATTCNHEKEEGLNLQRMLRCTRLAAPLLRHGVRPFSALPAFNYEALFQSTGPLPYPYRKVRPLALHSRMGKIQRLLPFIASRIQARRSRRLPVAYFRS